MADPVAQPSCPEARFRSLIGKSPNMRSAGEMTHAIHGIDHAIIGVADLDAARD